MISVPVPTYQEPDEPKCLTSAINSCTTPATAWDLAVYVRKLQGEFRKANQSLKILND